VPSSNYPAKPTALPASPAPAAIHLKKWEPNAPYYRRMQDADKDQLYAVYLDERSAYTSSSAFFLDAADILMERGQTELGLRVLSNLAEMQLENRQILRLLAYRLLQAKQPKLAIPVLRQIVKLAPHEPQSYRDLGLAYAEAGQDQQAVEQLWQVVEREWDNRFPDVELIALAEMNAVIARHQGTPLDLGRIDPRLLRNLPLDMRVVMTWDADNCDMDLWVTDPNGQKAYYGFPLTYQGGHMSKDFTQGYGPEEFSLRSAKPGTYTVEAHFFGNRQQIVAGATSLMLKFSSGFGTTEQKDQAIVLRLRDVNEKVLVGTFEVAPDGKLAAISK
jgi:tetratricopeptide (TPR) repeat protein